MKQLEKVINKNSYRYEYETHIENVGYIYRQVEPANGRVVAYEVFKHKINTLYDCVSFPGNEAFGVWAFSCATLDRALSHLNTWANETHITN